MSGAKRKAWRVSSYEDFLVSKAQLGSQDGFEPIYMPDFLFDFQAALVEWSLRKGRGAIFADCGLGKTAMQLVWAENVVRKTNKNVLILTPLAVAQQTVREGEKFGIECRKSSDGRVRRGISVTNYERLHCFSPGDFAGVVCDESSILKSFDGATKHAVTEFMRKIPYRLLATATAAPNDYIELGTSSEALGYLGHMDMLNRFFKNDNNNSGTRRHFGVAVKWRLKGHAEIPFWRWVASWARAMRKPSDLSFDDGPFILPALIETEHIVSHNKALEGRLFPVQAIGLYEQRQERRATINERCEKIAELVADTGKPALVWCHLNAEGDQLANLIDDARQVAGRDSDTLKEERLLAFANGEIRVLVTKPKIGGFGLNFQHCAHVTFFPSHSYEQYYQGVRRCWRFGQERPVVVDIVTTQAEIGVMKNVQRKASQADQMFGKLVAHMQSAMGVAAISDFDKREVIPPWL